MLFNILSMHFKTAGSILMLFSAVSKFWLALRSYQASKVIMIPLSRSLSPYICPL